MLDRNDRLKNAGGHKPWYISRRVTVPLILLAALLLVIGPWPADNTPYRQTAYFAGTVSRMEAPQSATGTLRVGTAEVDITPPVGHQLAGFSARDPFESDSVFSHCFARALTVASGGVQVTILSVDLLLVNDDLARAILKKSNLNPGDIFFTATHTHGGPGMWGKHPLEKLLVGDFDPDYTDRLATELAEVVSRSRASLVPVESALVTVDAPDNQVNRIDRNRATFDTLSALLFRRSGQAGAAPLAALVSFGAHATVAGHGSNAVSADYPGALVDQLKKTTGAANVLFAAGAVGDASPVRLEAETSEESAVKLGQRLADMLAEPVANARYVQTATLANAYLSVDLPDMRIPITSSLRLSPISTNWIGPGESHLQVLRIGPAVLVGFPGDYAGELARQITDSLSETGLTPIPTSFNGDYLGYVISGDDFYNAPKYETRIMNFYGPWLGPYLNDLAGSMTRALAD